MANRLLRGIAMVAGTGLAMGIGAGRPRSAAGPSSGGELAEGEEVLDIEPLLARVERLEGLADAPVVTPVPVVAAAPEVVDRGAEIGALERELARVQAEIPEVVARAVTQAVTQAVSEAVSQAVEERVGPMTRALAEQAASIEGLQARAAETDLNLQRLVSAIEKLCERAQLIAPEPGRFGQPGAGRYTPFAPAPPEPRKAEVEERRLPFESQLDDAMQRPPVVPVVRTEEPAEVRAEVDTPVLSTPKKGRFLFRS